MNYHVVRHQRFTFPYERDVCKRLHSIVSINRDYRDAFTAGVIALRHDDLWCVVLPGGSGWISDDGRAWMSMMAAITNSRGHARAYDALQVFRAERPC